MLQLLDAVAYMHDHWVIHRYVRPSLLFVAGRLLHLKTPSPPFFRRDLKMSNLLYKSGSVTSAVYCMQFPVVLFNTVESYLVAVCRRVAGC